MYAESDQSTMVCVHTVLYIYALRSNMHLVIFLKETPFVFRTLFYLTSMISFDGINRLLQRNEKIRNQDGPLTLVATDLRCNLPVEVDCPHKLVTRFNLRTREDHGFRL